MLINLESFFEILFNFTIFSLLVLVIYKLYKEYIYPFLCKSVSDIKKHQIDIKNRINLLDRSRYRLESLIKSQQSKFDLLDKKVELWHQSIEEKNRQLVKDRFELIKVIKEKRAKQRENFCLFRIEKETIVPSINQVYKTMRPIRSEQKGRNLLSELVNKIYISSIGEG